VGCHRRRRWRPGLTRRDPRAAPAPDLCQRLFSPHLAGPHVACDDQELPTDQGPLYLVEALDGCSRLVGHAMGERATAELAIAALQLAVWRRGLVDGDGLIHHSDEGSSAGSGVDATPPVCSEDR